MSTDLSSAQPRDRLRWAIRESFVIAGILLFWVGLGLILSIIAGLLRIVLARFPAHELMLVVELLQRVEFLWPGLTTAASATVGLYVVGRAGTLLIDHYRDGAD